MHYSHSQQTSLSLAPYSHYNLSLRYLGFLWLLKLSMSMNGVEFETYASSFSVC